MKQYLMTRYHTDIACDKATTMVAEASSVDSAFFLAEKYWKDTARCSIFGRDLDTMELVERSSDFESVVYSRCECCGRLL